ncbi:MAG: nucleotide pyrophosphohydrolase [SAR202 cluster bacterium]|nr:nucleotide pyrophosphohydrolase [SAR202 cluster bacterium]|tara:strand:- start:689 stop:1111 length:423 start_codon:yes stop_codon:yes gene_type:complete
MDIAALQIKLREFSNERNWEKYHSPKNLSMALSVEASELLEIFQWLTLEESQDKNNISFRKKDVQDELADILTYLLMLADVLEINLETAIQQKISENAKKYPADGEKTPISKRRLDDDINLDLTKLSREEQVNYIKKNFS